MTNTTNISLDQLVGAQSQQGLNKSAAKGASNTDLSGFIDALTSLLQGNAALNGQQLGLVNNPGENNLTLAVNLASKLQEQGLLPESMENISLGELSQGIFALLNSGELVDAAGEVQTQKVLDTLSSIIDKRNGVATDLNIKPSLITDLVPNLEANRPTDELLGIEKSDEVELSELLLGASEDIITTADIAQTMSQLEDPATKDEFVSDMLLKLAADAEGIEQMVSNNPNLQVELIANIKDQLAKASADGKVTPAELTAIKDTTVAELKALGLTDGEVKAQLIQLSKKLNNHGVTNNVDGEKLVRGSERAEQATVASMVTNDTMIKSASNTKAQNISAKISGMGVSNDLVQTMANAEFEGGDASDFLNRQDAPLYDLDGIASNTNTAKATTSSAGFTNYLTTAKGATSTQTTQMIAVQMQKNINAKVSQMKVQLMPENLGKLDINLKFGKDGSIKAHLVAEKTETLTMLQKDSAQLQKVLQEAGFEVSQDSLSFDLNQSSQEHLGAFKDNNNNQRAYNENFASSLDSQMSLDNMLQAQIAVEAAGYVSSNGVNIQV